MLSRLRTLCSGQAAEVLATGKVIVNSAFFRTKRVFGINAHPLTQTAVNNPFAVIFIHGFMSDASTFDAIRQVLADELPTENTPSLHSLQMRATFEDINKFAEQLAGFID